jgi:peptidoglycan/xylan/chitin deacetylase (PgdA/CDA1 family)
MKPFSLTVFMYHYVRDPGDRAEAGSGVPGLPVAHFEAQLDDATRHYEMIAWPALREYLMGQKSLPANACLLTFDDGVCDHYLNVFPRLKRRGLSGLFFALARPPGLGLTLAHKIHFLLARLGLDGLSEAIWLHLNRTQRDLYQQAEKKYQAKGYSRVNVLKGVLQRDLSAEADSLLGQIFAEHLGSEVETAQAYFLTSEHIAEMAADGMHFGGHSRSHPWFDWIDGDQQAEEIKASAEWLRGIEAGPWAFAYPYGGYDDHSAPSLRGHDFVAAFTTVDQTTHSDPFFIGRLDAEEFAGRPALSPLPAVGTH